MEMKFKRVISVENRYWLQGIKKVVQSALGNFLSLPHTPCIYAV